MSSNSGNVPMGNPPSNPSNTRQPKLMPHFLRMLPYLQINMHTNKFHTEHEDYIFSGTALTSMVELHMDRPAVVVAQPKIWDDDAPAQPDNQEEANVPGEEQSAADTQMDEVAASAASMRERRSDHESSKQPRESGAPAGAPPNTS
ncbi:hypothetical protein K523DRAFT_353935 [Schizophyllum commune Tattone D]|nr:hypothetical protein K523DRAFT_353935 [Schizophyllum commune Tattone D]